MARNVYKDYHGLPPCNFIIVAVLMFNQLGLFPLAHSSWLFFGKFRGLPATIGPRICDQMSLVPRQKEMCVEDPKVMMSVSEGAMKGISECQHQFRNERWNCSTMEKGQAVFGKVINRGETLTTTEGSREASFVHAITAAGVMYSVTRACSRGDLLSCSCDRRKHGESNDHRGSFTWGGCSDDIINGTYFVREFVDASEMNVQDARAEMNLHNNRAGRRAVKKFVKRQCKCHGKTGSCVLRTCWDAVGDFRQTGDYLKQKYDNAVHVTVTQNGPKGDIVSTEKHATPSKNDLVYLENSPNYCDRNTKIGTFGTEGRECNLTSNGSDGCTKLCCGRGYTTRRVTRVVKCKCMFHWCCEVRCEECSQVIDIHTCKGEPDELDVATTEATTSLTTTKSSKRRRGGGKGREKGRGKGRRRQKNRKRQRNRGRTKSSRRKRDVENSFSEDDIFDMDAVISRQLSRIRRTAKNNNLFRNYQHTAMANTTKR